MHHSNTQSASVPHRTSAPACVQPREAVDSAGLVRHIFEHLMAMSSLVWSLLQEALIRRQVEAYAADPSAGASKGQSSIQIRRDWKAKEEQLQVGLLSQTCSSVLCSRGHMLESVHVSTVARASCRQTSKYGQMLLLHSSSSTASALPACCMRMSVKPTWLLMAANVGIVGSLTIIHDSQCRLQISCGFLLTYHADTY